MKKISVIMPIYNSESTVRESIVSVINQTFNDYELILVNDGSTDSTEKICKEFQKKYNFIKYYKLNNGGVSRARNFGLSIAEAKYVCFIDSDDLYENNYLEVLYNNIDNGNDMVVCGYKLFGEKNKDFPCTIRNNIELKSKIEMLQGNIMFNQLWNKIYKLSIIKNNNLTFNENINLGEDAIFNIKYLLYCDDIYIISDSLYKYRITNSGLGFKYRKNGGEIKLNIFREMYKLYQVKGYNIKYIEKNIVKQYISWIANIVNKKNKDNIQEKFNDLSNIFKNEYYHDDYKLLDCSKYRILLSILNIRIVAYLTGNIANLYDNYQKKKIYN